MDISGLTSTSSSNSFTGYGGTASLPAITQAKITIQSQSLSLLPSASSPSLGNLADIYTAVGKQSLGALSGLSALEITQLSMGIGDGQTTATPPASSATTSTTSSGQTATDPTSTQTSSGSTSPTQDPAIGSTLDQILKEDGYVAPDANPYVVNTDFFASQGSLGGLLDSIV